MTTDLLVGSNESESSPEYGPEHWPLGTSSPLGPTMEYNERRNVYFRQPRSSFLVPEQSGSSSWYSESPSEVNESSEPSSGSQDDGQTSPFVSNVDYAFREADLYYGRCRRISFHQESTDSDRRNPSLTVKERLTQIFGR